MRVPEKRPPTSSDRDRRHRDSAGVAVPRGEFDPEDITGRYEGVELERHRREDRDIEERLRLADNARDDIRELRADAKKVGEKVAGHHEAIETLLKPIAHDLPGALEGIRLGMARLESAVNASAAEMRTALSTISLQLRSHHERIEAGEAEGRAHASRLTTVEHAQQQTAAGVAANAAEIVKLKRRATQQGADLRKWWRRHLGKAVAGALTLIAGAIAGAITAHYNPAPSPAVVDHPAHVERGP